MMYKRPLRFTTLHLEQRFRMDDETFIQLTPNNQLEYPIAKALIIHANAITVQTLLW